MKKIIIISILWYFFISTVQPQERVYVQFPKGGLSVDGFSVKIIENNIILLDSTFNLNSKGDLEKKFFGDFNAFVEFFYDPYTYGSALGFRIVKGKSDSSYVLEVKNISNFQEAQKETHKLRDSYQYEEMKKLFKIETRSFFISNHFAEELYKEMVSLIDNYKVKRVPQDYYYGCYNVAFRTVSGDEVWSLNIHCPRVGDALKMSDLCRQILTDARANKLDESKYLTILDRFEK